MANNDLFVQALNIMYALNKYINLELKSKTYQLSHSFLNESKNAKLES